MDKSEGSDWAVVLHLTLQTTPKPTSLLFLSIFSHFGCALVKTPPVGRLVLVLQEAVDIVGVKPSTGIFCVFVHQVICSLGFYV